MVASIVHRPAQLIKKEVISQRRSGHGVTLDYCTFQDTKPLKVTPILFGMEFAETKILMLQYRN